MQNQFVLILAVISMYLSLGRAIKVDASWNQIDEGSHLIRNVTWINFPSWDLIYDPFLYSEKCNIDRVYNLSVSDFEELYQDKRPVITWGVSNNTLFTKLCEKQQLLDQFGNYLVRLSTANTHSYDKVDLTFDQYVKFFMGPQEENRDGRSTLYYFGDNDFDHFQEPLFNHYVKPPYPVSTKNGQLSWGLAGSGSGVPFHTHGAVFAEVIHGMKRWFLMPPHANPTFDPDMSTMRWLKEIYPSIERDPSLLECVVKPGEILYLPFSWWHATLNIGQSVFISTFV